MYSTDILIQNYPLEDQFQKIVGVKAYINGTPTSNYSIIGGMEPYLQISPGAFNVLQPNASISTMAVYNVEVDVLGRFYQVMDFENAYVSGNYTLLIRKAENIVLNETLANYVKATSGWNYTNPLIELVIEFIRSKANSSNPIVILMNSINYIDDNIIYSIRMPPREPWETLLWMEGDCDDQSNLLVTLLRGLGIPSYQEYGMIYVSDDFRLEEVENNGLLNITMVGGGGHAWAVAYIPPWGWIRVDTVFGVKGNWLSHIVSIPYYNQPTVVMGISNGEASQLYWVGFEKSIATTRLKYVILYQVKVLGNV
ncbi:transglutaminase-like domain-containing protein [Thermogladius sp. 4427co]|uniref:transglutaminase-like domain-containing protein n=1 Tax=Thermogladius sp. 4427co TaxID=3450718 RepID=UPI003F7A9F95